MNGEFKIYFQRTDTEKEKLEIQNQCERLKDSLIFLFNNSLGGGSVTTEDCDGWIQFKYTCENNDPQRILNKVGNVVAGCNWLDRFHQHVVH